MGDSEKMLNKRDALLAMSHVQAGRPKEEAMNLSQIRPVVQEQVRAQERVATQAVGAVAQLFGNAINQNKDPAVKSMVRSSTLNTYLEMVS